MSPVGLQAQQEGGEVNNGAVYNLEGCFLHLDLHTTINNFAPNEFREVVNLSGLVVYKGSKHKGGNSSGDCNGKEIKAVKVNGVNYEGNMDQGSITFTVMSLSQKTINNY